MNSPVRRISATRVILISVLVVALLVLAGVVAVLAPILTHTSAGGSGQKIPTEIVSEASATGEDGRTRTLRVESVDGSPAELTRVEPGETVVVSGSGFDAGIGIYVAFCAMPENPKTKPHPCLGGIPKGAEAGGAAGQEKLSSAWITDAWAWKSFATQGYGDTAAGEFSVQLTVPEPTAEGLDCTKFQCAIATRADHTAAKDRVQDILLPIRYK